MRKALLSYRVRDAVYTLVCIRAVTQGSMQILVELSTLVATADRATQQTIQAIRAIAHNIGAMRSKRRLMILGMQVMVLTLAYRLV